MQYADYTFFQLENAKEEGDILAYEEIAERKLFGSGDYHEDPYGAFKIIKFLIEEKHDRDALFLAGIYYQNEHNLDEAIRMYDAYLKSSTIRYRASYWNIASCYHEKKRVSKRT